MPSVHSPLPLPLLVEELLLQQSQMFPRSMSAMRLRGC